MSTTVVIGNNTGNDYAGVEDALIYSPQPTNNWGSSNFLQIEKHASAESCSLVKFPLNSIEGGSTVISATLGLYGSNSWGTFVLVIRTVLRNWSESQVTYNIYSSGNNWGTAGCLGSGDRESESLGSISSTITEQYHVLSGDSLSQKIKYFIDGDQSNYGFGIFREEESDTFEYFQFDSSDSTDGQRPYLSVTYEQSVSSVFPWFLQHGQFNGGLL